MNQIDHSFASNHLMRWFDAMFLSRIGFGLIILGWVMFISGCGQGPGYSNATVTGTITIDGTPVPKGYVTFTPTGSGPVVGAEIVNGEYRCKHVPLGGHRVTFIAHAKESRIIIDRGTGQKHGVPKNILPRQYASGLSGEVNKDTTTLDFPLKSKP